MQHCCRFVLLQCNGEVIKLNRNVFLYGFNRDDACRIKSFFSDSKFVVIEITEFMDLLAGYACAVIISADRFSEDDFDLFFSAYRDTDTFSEVIVFVGELPCKSKDIKKFNVCSDIDAFCEKGKYFALQAVKKEKKRHTFSSTVSMAIRILAEIQNNPGITSAQLAENCEVSIRTVQRNVETLKMSGESIIKDPVTKGWRLEFQESLLLIQSLPAFDSKLYFDKVFAYRELLREYLVDCGLNREEAFELSERVRKGYYYEKGGRHPQRFSHPEIPKDVTDWFGKVKYLPSVRRLLEDEQ